MANVVMAGLKKLSVAETLTQATKALQTHRNWMKKRISVAPLDDDGPFELEVRETERKGGKNRARGNSGERGSIAFVEGSALVEETHQGTSETHSAPPPFEIQARGGSARIRRSAQVAPVHMLGSLTEDAAENSEKGWREEKGRKLQVAWGSTSDNRGQPAVREDIAIAERLEKANKLEKRKGEEPMVSDAATKPKRKHLSKASVVPSEITTDRPGQTGPPRNSKATDMFLRPPPVPVWGSLTSLDNYTPGSGRNVSDVSTVQDDAFASASTSEHIEVLQSTSSATIVPVSPAPKEQRSSYALHHQSKLTASEAGLELLKVEPDVMSGKGRTAHSSSILVADKTKSGPLKSQELPESILQPVLPARRQRRTGASVVSTPPPTFELQASKFTYATTDTQGLQTSHELVVAKQDRSTMATKVHPANETMVPFGGAQENGPLPSGELYQDLNLPPLKEQLSHHIYKDGGEIVKQLPPLKLQSPSGSSLTELKLSRKRERTPPSYAIHCPRGKKILAPPCPEYGIIQPLESEVLKIITRRVSQSESPDFSTPFQSPSASRRTSTSSELGSMSRRGSQAAINTSRRGSQAAISTSNQTGQTDAEYRPSDQSDEHDVKPPLLITKQNSQPNLQSDPARQLQLETASPSIHHSSSYHGGLAELQQEAPSLTNDPREPPISLMPTGPGPLHLAAKSGNLRQLAALISQGHDVNTPDQDGKTPLMYCIHTRGVHLPCADTLIKEAANLNKQASDGSTAIHMAAFTGAVSLIELLLLNGANPDIKDFDGRLPLHWGTRPNSFKCIDVLTKHSSLTLDATDDAGMTPLMWASYNNNPTITRYLLTHGADCEEKDNDGYTTMHWAVHKDSTECLELLLQPDMTYFKDHKGCTVMHHAARAGSMNACEVILKMRPDAIHDTDKQGRTPLHYAAACSKVDVCALILDRGGDASQKDVGEQTALDYARKKKLDYVVALLTCHGTAVADFARASRSTSVSSLLSRAASFSQLPLRSPDVVSENLSSGLTPSILTASNSTILGEDSEMSVTGQLLGDTDSRPVDTTKGSFLGRFVSDAIDPLQHFYFWLKPRAGTICWSRDFSKRYPKEAIILEIHEGPSNSVRHSPAYSPHDLHRFVFWVMTDSGIVDLMAYNEEAYITWVNEIGRLAQRNENTGVSGHKSRPLSSRKSPPSEPEISADSDARSRSRTKTPPQSQGDPALASNQRGSSSPPMGAGGWTKNQRLLPSLRDQGHNIPGSGQASLAEPQQHSTSRSFLFSKKTQPQPLTSTPYNSPHIDSILASRIQANPAVQSEVTPKDPSFLYSDDII